MTAGEIVIAALGIAPVERLGYLKEVCASDCALLEEVRALLKEESEEEDPDPTLAIQSSIQEGDLEGSIGSYRLIRILGEGGMGVVHHAQQLKPIRREVALKVIKPGMDSQQVISRFESERQALAMMDHANIARVFDAGTTAAGLPYFAMELVDGIPITRYCDSKRLTIKERVELFIPVCQAIQHAHQKGIIHRDIKPSNVLVRHAENQAVPKVIDFGLAKALGNQLGGDTVLTNLGTVLGTLDYMSPEQAELGRQDIDTRSDIYSLGALLYELLSGTLPLDHTGNEKRSYVEILQRIREEEPKPPSNRLSQSATLTEIAERRRSDPKRLPKQVARELDWIVMKALEKDRTRRYETVNGMARDLQRYLAGDPVEAGPPSTAYRMGKFVRRYRLWLATAALFTAVLVVGVVVSTWMAVRASRAEQEAKAVNSFLRDDLLAQAGASTQATSGSKIDPDLKVRTALDRAAARLEGKFTGQPLVEASIRQTIGLTYKDLGLFTDAQRQHERVVELRRRILGDWSPDTLASISSLGTALERQGKYSQAEPLYVKTLEAQRRVLGESHVETLSSMKGLAAVLYGQGKYAQAEVLLARVLAVGRRLLGEEHLETAVSMGNLAAAYHVQGKYGEAEPLYAKAIEIFTRMAGEEYPDSLKFNINLAELYGAQGKYAQSEPLYTKALQTQRRLLGENHRSTIYTMNSLAELHVNQGKFWQAEQLYTKALEASRKVFNEEHPFTLISLNGLAEVYYSQHKYAQAEVLLVKVWKVRRRVLGEDHPETLTTMSDLGRLYTELGKYEQAEGPLTKVLEVRRRLLGPQDPKTTSAMTSLNELQLRQKKTSFKSPTAEGGVPALDPKFH